VINWENDSTETILKKALAADSQPGLKVTLIVGDRIITRFSYGYTIEK